MNLMGKKEGIHDEHCRQMALKPGIIGLDNIVLSTSESHLFYKGSLLGEPDGLMFDPTTHTLYNVEYKCHGYNDKARSQLWKTKNRLKTMFNDWNIVNLYVHDDYRVERC